MHRILQLGNRGGEHKGRWCISVAQIVHNPGVGIGSGARKCSPGTPCCQTLSQQRRLAWNQLPRSARSDKFFINMSEHIALKQPDQTMKLPSNPRVNKSCFKTTTPAWTLNSIQTCNQMHSPHYACIINYFTCVWSSEAWAVEMKLLVQILVSSRHAMIKLVPKIIHWYWSLLMCLDLQLLIVINSIVLLKMLESITEFITKLKHILQIISHDYRLLSNCVAKQVINLWCCQQQVQEEVGKKQLWDNYIALINHSIFKNFCTASSNVMEPSPCTSLLVESFPKTPRTKQNKTNKQPSFIDRSVCTYRVFKGEKKTMVFFWCKGMAIGCTAMNFFLLQKKSRET